MTRKLTRLEDIAALAGVSISTASRALNDSPAVNDRTKQKIWKLAREHDYPFRRYMPAGPAGATGTIAMVVPRPQGRDSQLDDPFFLELVAGISDAARERGCDLLISHFTPTSYDDLSAAMTTTRADGVPQLLVATIMGSIMKRWFPDEPIWTMAFAAGVMVLAALAMLRVREDQTR